MINSLHLKNFKCFKDQEFELGKLTLLTGLNSTGKSSVIQSLLLLRQSNQRQLLRDRKLLLNGDLVQLGMALDVLCEHAEATSEIEFRMQFSVKEEATRRKEEETWRKEEATWRFNPSAREREVDVLPQGNRLPTTTAVYRSSLFGDQFHYLPAERIGPQSVFEASDFIVQGHRQLGVKGEFAPHFLLAHAEAEITEKKLIHEKTPNSADHRLHPQVEAWMGEISPGVSIEVESFNQIDRVGLRYNYRAGGTVGTNDYRSTNVGFGVTYTLPILLALLASKEDTLVLLENPEAHLHPQGQFKLGELMVRAASCGIQVIVESHSDHVLNGIRIAVKDKIITPDKVKLFYLSRSPEDGVLNTIVNSPQVNENGRIDDWPEGFFDEFEKRLVQLL